MSAMVVPFCYVFYGQKLNNLIVCGFFMNGLKPNIQKYLYHTVLNIGEY